MREEGKRKGRGKWKLKQEERKWMQGERKKKLNPYAQEEREKDVDLVHARGEEKGSQPDTHKRRGRRKLTP